MLSSAARAAARVPAKACIGLVRAYQATLAPIMGGHCRYLPSCSEYAVEALREWGAIRGSWLACRRICRCHPLGGHGADPVPLRKTPKYQYFVQCPTNVGASASKSGPIEMEVSKLVVGPDDDSLR